MPNYKYKAVRDDGTSVFGEAFALSEQMLESHLAQRGLFLTQARPASRLRPRAGIGDEPLLLFLKQFSALLRAGQSVPEALRLAREAESGATARLLEQTLANVKAGDSLSEAFSKSESLDPMFTSLLKTGERSGAVVRVLQQYESFLERRIVLRRKLTQAMLYPLFVLMMLAVIVVVLFVFSLPRFVEMYAGLGADLPAATRSLIAISGFLANHGSAIALVLAALVVGGRQVLSRSSVREYVDRFLFNAPLLGFPVRYHALAVFTRSLATQLGSGVGLVEALKQVSDVLPNAHMAAGVRSLAERIAGGMVLSQAFSEAQFLPAIVRNLITVGDQDSDAASRLRELAAYYETLLDYRVTTLVSLLEPTLILVTGLIVGTIVIIMYLPVFSLAEVVG